MNSELVETFLKIVKYRQISLAADALFITQAGVSNRLNKLEKHLGVKLINRVKGHAQITLTEYGKKFIPLAKQYLSIIESANELKNEPHYDRITIATTFDICGLYISPLVKFFNLSNPEIRLNIKCTDRENIDRLVNEMQADIGIQPFDTNNPKLSSTKIFGDHLVVVTSGNKLLPDNISVENLDKRNEIFIDYNNDKYKVWHNVCWDSTITPAITTNTVMNTIPTLLSSDQWAIVPSQITDLFKESLSMHHLTELKFEYPIYAIQLKNSVKSSPIRQIISLMRFYLARSF